MKIKLINKGVTVFRYFYLFLFLSLFIIGCSEESNVLSPVNTVSSEPNWIALPAPEGLQTNASFTESASINGQYGGTISLYRSYYAGYYRNVVIDADITFPNYSFSGTKYISMTCDDQTCVTSFSPSMVFSKKASFTVMYKGVDLSDINTSNIKFAYLASDGSVQYAEHEGITVNKFTGTLKVVNAKIPHFSRYGFVN